jgi:NADH-quinone oxidoreductase subunit M
MSLLSAIFLVPLLAALLVLVIPRDYRFLIRLVALGATLVSLALAFALFAKFDAAPAVDGFKFDYQKPWVPALGINYHVGVDGLNLGLIVMGAMVAFAAACCSHEIKSRDKDFYFLLLLMTGGILGAFASLDLVFLYFFHELALVPTFIMIGVWGRGEEKNYATFKMTLYLSLGALIALAGLIALYFESGARTFDIVALTKHAQANPRMFTPAAQGYVFPLLLFGFGILVSLWPLHTWAPLGYGAAPTATAMLHAGVLKKFGLYGLIRVALPLMPEGSQPWLHVLAWLCLGNILHCGLVAARQRDLNLLLGNSSVAHMGFVFLGIASLNLAGITGAVVVMVAHGLLAALAFGLAGYVRQQAGTLDMDKLGGLVQPMPFVGAAFLMAALAGCGLPGFGNFAGEVMVLFGAWRSFELVVAFAAWGTLVVGAVYMLRSVRNIFHGPLSAAPATMQDAGAWRRVPFVLLLGGLMAIGVWPRLLVDNIKTSAAPIVKMANGPEFAPANKAPKKSAAAVPQAPAK